MRIRKVSEPLKKVRVLKFPVPIDDQWHELPYVRDTDSSVPWHIGMQGDVVMVWCVPAETDQTDKLKVVGTGHYWHPHNHYVGTVQDPRGFVWHLIAGGHE